MTYTIPSAPRIQNDPCFHLHTASELLEISLLRAVLEAEHYFNAGRPTGHVLWQVVYQHDPEDGSENLVATLLAANSSSPASMLSTTSSPHPLAL